MRIVLLPLISMLVLLSLTGGSSRAGDEDLQTPLIVGDITFVKEKGGRERICIPFNRTCLPNIFSIPGKNPRIVLDLEAVSRWPGKEVIPTNGLLIQQVRMHLHKNDRKLRVVLDLNPAMDYDVAPSYYEAENVYCVDVSSK
jgi:hypothetical protein